MTFPIRQDTGHRPPPSAEYIGLEGAWEESKQEQEQWLKPLRNQGWWLAAFLFQTLDMGIVISNLKILKKEIKM